MKKNLLLSFIFTITTIYFSGAQISYPGNSPGEAMEEKLHGGTASAAPLKAGVAKVNITNTESAGLIHDSLYVKALVIEYGATRAVIISVDAVAIGEAGSISNDYLANVRSQVQKDLNIKPLNILVNASHLHGAGYRVCPDVEQRTIEAVKIAFMNMVPVSIGVGTGYEDRIMENRRLKLKDGNEWTIRHANPLPPDEEVIGVGPIDPEIGILRLNRENGKTLAVVYNFACHPYQGIPSRRITADFPGIASQVIEDNLSEGTVALFLQGCSGDITTVLYKDVNNPRDAVSLGNMLGISTLQALKKIECTRGGNLNVISEIIKLPRRTDIPQRIDSLNAEQEKLLHSLKGMSLNLKTFIPLYIKYNLYGEYPSYYSHRYINEEMLGRNGLEVMDDINRRNIDKYLRNIYTMERLSRIQTNLAMLKKRQAMNEASGEKTIDVEVQVIRIGNFILVSFPGEVSVQVGLNIKNSSPYEFTFIAGYSNGYIHYAPTSEQYNAGGYEVANCLLALGWQKIYEEKVLEILKRL